MAVTNNRGVVVLVLAACGSFAATAVGPPEKRFATEEASETLRPVKRAGGTDSSPRGQTASRKGAQRDQANWPSYLSGQLVRPGDAADAPQSWTPEDVSWSASVEGYGQSSPIAWDNVIYSTSVSGGEKEALHVTAISLFDGQVNWTRTFRSTAPETSGYLISRAAPTPVCDRDGLFAYFESGDLFALDHRGEPRWHVSLAERFGRFDNKFGLAASPVLTEQAVIVLADHDGPSYVAAFRRDDGTLLWKRDRPGGRSWSSPSIVRVGDRDQLVCSSAGTLEGYDPKTGETLWTHEEIGGNTVATPIDLGDGRFLVASLIRPADGPTPHATESNLLAKIVQDDQAFRLDVQWVAAKARGSFCSPIASGDNAYWVNPTGVVYCLNLDTGEERFAERLPCGACWATPLAVDDRVYFFGRKGEATILSNSQEFEVISTGHRTRDPDDRPPSDPPEPSEAKAEAGNEPDAARRRAAAMNSGVTLYAAILVGPRLIVRYGDRIDCVPVADGDRPSR